MTDEFNRQDGELGDACWEEGEVVDSVDSVDPSIAPVTLEVHDGQLGSSGSFE